VAPKLLGAEARHVVVGFGVDRLADCANFAPLDRIAAGPDLMLTARRV
jgi:riboflavin biosynthesis pyrimidine reductase